NENTEISSQGSLFQFSVPLLLTGRDLRSAVRRRPFGCPETRAQPRRRSGGDPLGARRPAPNSQGPAAQDGPRSRLPLRPTRIRESTGSIPFPICVDPWLIPIPIHPWPIRFASVA